ncbi:MAG: phenylalanine--tRNA ligase subunit alpha [Anaerolineae bacterium]
MGNDLVELALSRARAELEAVRDRPALDAWRAAHLGRDGALSGLVRRIPELPPEDRPAFGQAVNAAKKTLEAEYAAAREALRRTDTEAEAAGEPLDVTLPGTPPPAGGLHPVTAATRRIATIFAAMGFQVHESREVETDRFNFELLNMPPDHPARDMQDTFYIDADTVLRTHTSPGQIHAMAESCPEAIRIIVPGTVYRHEQITPRSDIQFSQVEGLAVGPGITMADLKGTLLSFASRMFGPGRPVRFRASYFPFTEPSAEMDVECFLCEGAGCRVCKHAGWLEILGCGMVHPVVLANGGYDPAAFSGFAFGMGVERIAMLRYGIDDIRHFLTNDLRFLAQFR